MAHTTKPRSLLRTVTLALLLCLLLVSFDRNHGAAALPARGGGAAAEKEDWSMVIAASGRHREPHADSTAGSNLELVPEGFRGLVPSRFDDDDEARNVIRHLSTKQLRTFLHSRGAHCDDCVEKADLVERAYRVRGWATADDYVVAALAPTVDSGVTHLAVHHVHGDSSLALASNGAEEEEGGAVQDKGGVLHLVFPPVQTEAMMADHAKPSRATVATTADGRQLLCEAPMANGTAFCHSMSEMQRHAHSAVA